MTEIGTFVFDIKKIEKDIKARYKKKLEEKDEQIAELDKKCRKYKKHYKKQKL